MFFIIKKPNQQLNFNYIQYKKLVMYKIGMYNNYTNSLSISNQFRYGLKFKKMVNKHFITIIEIKIMESLRECQVTN